MNQVPTRLVTVVCMAVLVTMSGVGAAYAQFDHLKCYKAKDTKAFKKARADLTALQAQFGIAEDCEIKPKAKLFCVPAAKSVTSIEEGTDNPFPAEDLAFDRLCYTIKCPKTEIAPEEVSDQFGTRTLEKFKAAMLCTPAVKGAAPTTTTTIGGCLDGQTQPCGSDVGECAAGIQTCSGGVFGACVGEIGPTAEQCDALDNNCDGVADEGNPDGGAACDGFDFDSCLEGILICASGLLVCDDNTGDSVEVCDGLDNDCDGTPDDGNPDGGSACNTGMPGVCALGTTSCSGGSLVCAQNQSATTEICDGADNDCDGAVDEGNPGGGFACNTGLQGACAAGTVVCSGGVLFCNQNVMATTETCGDGIDNDCDGFVDEGC